MTRTHFRTCNLCEAMCGVAIETDGARIVGIKPDADDIFSHGHICPKAVALQDLHEDPDRLRRPQRRTRSGSWETVGWNEALREVADELAKIRDAHGRDAIAVYRGNPISHNYGLAMFSQLLLESLRTKNVYSAGSVDQFPVQLASLLMFGHQFLMPIPDIDRTDYLLMLGANPAVSNGSVMTAPDAMKRLTDVRRRGGKFVLIDPRRNESARYADEHHFIRPGTDALFLAAILHTMSNERLFKLGRFEMATRGKDAIHVIVKDFAPERVATTVGIDAEIIRRLAREFAGAPSAVCYGRMGTCAQEFGATTSWLINVLNIMTGNFDRAGGSMFTTPAVDMLLQRQFAGSYAKHVSRVRSLPEFADELPAATLADEIETPGPGQIRGLLTIAGNPILSTPNGRRLDRAFGSLSFMASIDHYLNETTRHAHMILPPLSPLERDHYDLVYTTLAVRNVAKYHTPVFPPPADALDDGMICLELNDLLQRRDGLVPNLLARLQTPVLRRLRARGLLNLMLRFGPYGGGFNPFAKGLSVKSLLQAEHGIDLGPLQSCLPERLGTDDRRIDLAPAPFRADAQRLQNWLTRQTASRSTPASDTHELLLIGRRQLRSSNSWMHNWERLVRGRDRCTLMMHPGDASDRGLVDGQIVQVASRIGSVHVPLEVTDGIMAGVVSLPHGWGHDRIGAHLRVAAEHAGVSANDLTDEFLIDPLSGVACLNGVPVQVHA